MLRQIYAQTELNRHRTRAVAKATAALLNSNQCLSRHPGSSPSTHTSAQPSATRTLPTPTTCAQAVATLNADEALAKEFAAYNKTDCMSYDFDPKNQGALANNFASPRGGVNVKRLPRVAPGCESVQNRVLQKCQGGDVQPARHSPGLLRAG